MNKECINSLIEKECNYISKMIDRGASNNEIADITNALAALITASAFKTQIISSTVNGEESRSELISKKEATLFKIQQL